MWGHVVFVRACGWVFVRARIRGENVTEKSRCGKEEEDERRLYLHMLFIGIRGL